MTNKIDFNDQQKAAIAKAVKWFKDWQDYKHRDQIFFLAGFAGTGKTSVAMEIAEKCAPIHRVVFIAPTGKAASRLRQKGCRTAKTLHQFLYNVRGEDEDGDPIFIGKGALEESPILVVMDEASMVGQYDNDQLKSHGIAILALGDTGQLRPVKAPAVYTKGREDVLLTQIERNAGNIVRASMFVREGKRLPPREYDDFCVRIGRPTDEDLLAHANEQGQVLCARNATRVDYNTRIRKMLGYTNHVPEIGEKVVCLFNQHGHGFMNGEQGIVQGYADIKDYEKEDNQSPDLMYLNIKSLTDGKNKTVKFNPLSFDKDPDVRAAAAKAVGGFDFGWALTIHKAQGSEWDNILLVEETIPGGDYAELMYTGITRAIKRCTLYRTN